MSTNWTPKKRSTLIKRIRPWVYCTSDSSEPCLSIKVTQINDQGVEFRKVTKFGHPDPWPVDIETLTTSIIDFLQEDADQQKRHVSYMLTPLYGASLIVGDDSLQLGVDGTKPDADDYELSGAPVEGSTPQGKVGQEYRHLENMFRMYAQGVKDNMENLRAENISLRTRSEGDDARRLNFYKRMDEASAAAWKIRREEEQEKFVRENIRELIDVTKPLVRQGFNKLGAKVLGNGPDDKPLLAEPDQEEVMLEQFFGDMQCTCDEPDKGGRAACEWHNLLDSAAPKRKVMLNMMASRWFEIKEKRAGQYKGDRPIGDETNATVEKDPTKH